jgi:hypothetical protein
MAQIPETKLLPCPKCGRNWWWANTNPDEAFCPSGYGCRSEPEQTEKAVQSVSVAKVVFDKSIGKAEVYVSDGNQLYRLNGLTSVIARSEIDSVNEFEIKGYVYGGKQ